MKDNVHFLAAHAHMKVDEAFSVAMRNNLTDVIIIGYGDDGDLVINSSHMTRAEALFMLEKSKMHTMGI